MTKSLRIKIVKYVLYVVIIFTLFIIQSTPRLLDFCGIKPNLVLPACICIAIFEGEFVGGLFGFFAGLFCDTAAETIFGFNAFFYLVFCVAVGLATIYILQNDTLNAMLLCLGGLLFVALTNYFFSFVLYQYDGLPNFFYVSVMPPVVLSSIFSFPCYYLFKWLYEKFESRLEDILQ